jgi:pimeloyl-ACP methyl ester carboxylesterase
MLKANGPPPYSGQGMFIKYADYIALVEKGAKTNGAKGSMIDGELALVAMTAPEYSLTDKINWFRGVIKGLELVYPQVQAVDLLSGPPGLDLPVYFMTGRYDYNTNSALVERYFNHLQAPQKELVRFEKSGRNLCFSEADKFNSVMINKVLPETYNR